MRLIFALLWLLPTLAFSQATFTNEAELGIASANGNSKTQTVNAKESADVKWAMNVLSLRSRYLNANARGVETARYFMAGLRYERELSNHFGLFVGETLEKDRFANIDKRLLSDIGGKYRYIETERTKFFSELGYRYFHEDRLDDSQAFSSYGRLYNEWEHKWSPNYSTKLWNEYLPNFSDAKDWLLNSEASISVMINEVFSLKTSMLVRYDHSPAPGVIYKTDSLFSTALVGKF